MQEREDGVLNQANSDTGGKKWLPGHILKVEPTEFADGLDMGHGMTLRDFGLSYQKNREMLFREMEKAAGDEALVKGKSVWVRIDVYHFLGKTEIPI